MRLAALALEARCGLQAFTIFHVGFRGGCGSHGRIRCSWLNFIVLFVISQVVRDDTAPAELAHLRSEVVRYLGTASKIAFLTNLRNINFLRVNT